jgi:hypothetical protein
MCFCVIAYVHVDSVMYIHGMLQRKCLAALSVLIQYKNVKKEKYGKN